jgi:hypothetical protein
MFTQGPFSERTLVDAFLASLYQKHVSRRGFPVGLPCNGWRAAGYPRRGQQGTPRRLPAAQGPRVLERAGWSRTVKQSPCRNTRQGYNLWAHRKKVSHHQARQKWFEIWAFKAARKTQSSLQDGALLFLKRVCFQPNESRSEMNVQLQFVECILAYQLLEIAHLTVSGKPLRDLSLQTNMCSAKRGSSMCVPPASEAPG